MNETDVEIVDQAPAQDLDPMEVISVEELLGRLAEEQEAAAEEEAVPEEETEPEPLEVAGTDETIRLLETIQTQLTPYPFLTTPFEEYTVTEGLLLLLVLAAFAGCCIKLLRRGFSWLW